MVARLARGDIAGLHLFGGTHLASLIATPVERGAPTTLLYVPRAALCTSMVPLPVLVRLDAAVEATAAALLGVPAFAQLHPADAAFAAMWCTSPRTCAAGAVVRRDDVLLLTRGGVSVAMPSREDGALVETAAVVAPALFGGSAAAAAVRCPRGEVLTAMRTLSGETTATYVTIPAATLEWLLAAAPRAAAELKAAAVAANEWADLASESSRPAATKNLMGSGGRRSPSALAVPSQSGSGSGLLSRGGSSSVTITDDASPSPLSTGPLEGGSGGGHHRRGAGFFAGARCDCCCCCCCCCSNSYCVTRCLHTVTSVALTLCVQHCLTLAASRCRRPAQAARGTCNGPRSHGRRGFTDCHDRRRRCRVSVCCCGWAAGARPSRRRGLGARGGARW